MDGGCANLWELAPVGMEWCHWPDRSLRLLNQSISGAAFYSAFVSIFHVLWSLVWLLSFPMSGHCLGIRLTFIIMSLSYFFWSVFAFSLSVSIPACLWLCLSFRGLVHILVGAKMNLSLSLFMIFLSVCLLSLSILSCAYCFISWLHFSPFSCHTPLNSTLLSPCESQQQGSSCVPLHRTMR